MKNLVFVIFILSNLALAKDKSKSIKPETKPIANQKTVATAVKPRKFVEIDPIKICLSEVYRLQDDFKARTNKYIDNETDLEFQAKSLCKDQEIDLTIERMGPDVYKVKASDKISRWSIDQNKKIQSEK